MRKLMGFIEATVALVTFLASLVTIATYIEAHPKLRLRSGWLRYMAIKLRTPHDKKVPPPISSLQKQNISLGHKQKRSLVSSVEGPLTTLTYFADIFAPFIGGVLLFWRDPSSFGVFLLGSLGTAVIGAIVASLLVGYMEGLDASERRSHAFRNILGSVILGALWSLSIWLLELPIILVAIVFLLSASFNIVLLRTDTI